MAFAMIDFRLRVRSAAAAVALVLSWFAIATILAEGLTAKRRSFSPGATPDWAVGIAPLRGDLLADVAFERATPLFKPGKAPALPETQVAREKALAIARQSLSLAPHSSRTWLLAARLESLTPERPSAAIEALKMSYLTSSADFDLIPTRLEAFSALTESADAELENLVRGDLRLILMRRPELKSAISSAYEKGSREGKSSIYDLVTPLDPNFAATLR